MAYVTHSQNDHDLIERALFAVSQVFKRAADAHAERRAFRRTLAELSSLSDRELNDLGIARGNLRSVAWASAKDRNVR